MTHPSKRHEAGWDDIADVLQEDSSRAYRYAKCLRYLPGAIAPEGAVCDVGCGEGTGLALLRAAGYECLTGLEVSGQRLKRARQRLGDGVSLVQIAPEGTLPFSDGSFEAVISAAVIEHTIDPAEHVSELARIVKTGGIVVIASDCFTYRLLQVIGVYRSVQPIDRAVFPPTLLKYCWRSGLSLVHAEGFPIPGEEYRILRLLALAAKRCIRRVVPQVRSSGRGLTTPAVEAGLPDPGAWRPRHWLPALPGLLFSDENVFFLLKTGGRSAGLSGKDPVSHNQQASERASSLRLY